MPHDPILAEVWAIKERLAAEHDYDVRKMLEDVMRRQRSCGHPLIEPPETGAAASGKIVKREAEAPVTYNRGPTRT